MPHVSVVVPIYDVEPYLAACLESLAAQTWRDLEVVMVDDGSPDGSAEIAARFAERDSRFRLFRQRNAGLGAARNAGIARARGELMMFVDSDDLLPLGAVEAMVSTLARTGSDFVTGNVSRFTSLKVYASPMHKAVFAEPELRTHVGRQEILLKDRLVTNKLWRRSFWDEHGLAFPEGVLYEDIPVALPAQFLAKSVDMLAEPVYLWREREGDRPSITQDRAQVKGIEDRLGSIMTVRNFLERTGRVEHLRSWDRMVLESDLTAFFPAFAGADRVFRDRFRELSTQYLDRVSPETLREVAVLRRLRWYLLREGAYDELIEAMDWEGEGKLTGSRRGASFYLDCPVPGLPPEALRLGSRDLDLQQKVDAIGWEDGRLAVQGRVTMRYLRPLKRLHQLAFATLVHDTTGKRIRLRLKKFLADPIGRGKRKTWGGYRFAVDPAALLAEEPGRWYVELGVLHRGMHRKARLAGLSEQVAHEAEAARPAPGVRVTPGRTCSGRFVLDVERETARVSGWRVDGDRLVVTGTAWESAPDRCEAVGGSRRVECAVTAAGQAVEVAVDLRELAGTRRPDLPSGSVEARVLDVPTDWRLTGGFSVLDGLAATRHLVGGRELVIGPGAGGELVIREQAPAVLVERAGFDAEGVLELRGRLPYAVEGEAVVVAGSKTGTGDAQFTAEVDGHDVVARLAPLAVPSLAGLLPLPRGGYRLTLATGAAELPLEYGGATHELHHSGRDLRFSAELGGNPVLTLGSDLTREEHGSARQTRLRDTYYPAAREEPLQDAVFFDSYTGKQFSDSPKAIHDELVRRGLPLELRWNVRDGQVELPATATPVRMYGAEYYQALARSRFVVTNAHLPVWFRRREGQVVVQTWHGSTLKRIGYDIEDVQFARSDYHERLAVEVPQWDYLLSPSPWCTPILRGAFRFGGEVLETGYPRNDVLFDPELGAEVRRRLGIPDGKRIVLYAPTWRDDRFHGNGKYVFDLQLDLDRWRERLGEDHVLLIRRHPNIAGRLRVSDPTAVMDVSAYPDVQELYLAADALVTDYSSAMFDFAVTGRPMLFFTYDLEHYRDQLRGFYFDFEAEAPGPLLRTAEDLMDAIEDLDAVAARYAALYESFRARFCPLDDGQAAARVVDTVFAGWSRSGMDSFQ